MSKYWIGKSKHSNTLVFFAGDIGFLIGESESTEHINPKNWTIHWAQSNFANITPDYLRNTKIRIESPEHSRMVQELVFGAGGDWADRRKFAQKTDSEFIFIEDRNDLLEMTHEPSDAAYFNSQPKKEIHLPMPPESQLPEVDSGTPISDTNKDNQKLKVGDKINLFGQEMEVARVFSEEPIQPVISDLASEWPQVGDKASIAARGKVVVIGLDGDEAWVKCDCESSCNDYASVRISTLRKLSPQERLADTLTDITGYQDRQAVMRAAKAILEGAVPELEYKGGEV